MASTIVLTPSTDKTGAADTAAVNAALGGVGAGGSVLLGPGDWFTSAPLSMPTGVELTGIKGGINGKSATTPAGTVIHPVRRVQRDRRGDRHEGGRGRGPDPGPGGAGRPGLTGRTSTASPATATSTAWRSCTSRWPWSAGYGLAYYRSSAGGGGDGLWMSRCMFQRIGKIGGVPARQRRQHPQRPHPVRRPGRRARGRPRLLLASRDRQGTRPTSAAGPTCARARAG